MRIRQYLLNLGTLFIVNRNIDDDETHNISEWMWQNNIQHIFDYPCLGEFHYFIRDEASIMAFKLRWM